MTLRGVPILCVAPDLVCLADTVGLLEAHGCSVQLASSRTAALCTLWKMYAEGGCPRAVITDWHLVPPRSTTQLFYDTVGRPKWGCADTLLARIADLDSSIGLVVRAADRSQVLASTPHQVVAPWDLDGLIAAVDRAVYAGASRPSRRLIAL